MIVFCLFFICVFLLLYPVVLSLAKIRLAVKVREQGSRIESVPVKHLIVLAGCSDRRWSFEDGWLVLEGS